MQFDAMPEHRDKFGPFQEFLKTAFPKFVKSNPAVEQVLHHRGLYCYVPEFHHAGTFPDARQRKQIINGALTWGQPPVVWPMSQRFFGGGMGTNRDAVGAFDGKKIMLHRPMVEAWQERRTRYAKKPNWQHMLHRWMFAVTLHELVHYLQWRVLPNRTSKLKDDHFNSWEKDLYGRLGWQENEYRVYLEWMTVLGIPM